MQRVSGGVAKLARCSLRSGVSRDGTAPRTPGEVFRQRYEALSSRLIPLVGRQGFGALLSRALARAKADHPWLDGVEVDPAGSFPGLEEVLSRQEAAEGEAGCAAILAHCLALLTAMVGAELTGQMVSGAWPDLPVRDAEFGAEEDEV